MIAETRRPSGDRGHRIEMAGQRIGCLEVVGPAPGRGRQREARWTCRCTLCGAEVEKGGTELRRGVYARCGPNCGKPDTPPAPPPTRAQPGPGSGTYQADVHAELARSKEPPDAAPPRKAGDGPKVAATAPGLGAIVAGYLAEWRAGRNPLAPGGIAMGGGGDGEEEESD